MKGLRTICNVLFALMIVVSLGLATPTAVFAYEPEAEPAPETPTVVNITFGPSSQSTVDASVIEPQADGWITVSSMDFEGAFPGTWLTADNNGSTGGSYTWGPATARAHTGTKSGYMAVGSSGVGPSTPPTSYPANLNSGIGYGTFSLVGATDARVTFWVWMNADPTQSAGEPIDLFRWMGSDDGGQGYAGEKLGGNTNGWVQYTYDLKNFDGSGTSLLGNSQVMIAFTFQSDGANNNYEGAYIDDIVIEKKTNDTPTCYSLTTAVDPVDSGTVTVNTTPNCNGNQYTAGTVVTLTANANQGYTFSSWTNATAGTGTTGTVTMDANKSVIANFTANQPCYTLSTAVSPANSGQVTVITQPNCGTTKYTQGTSVEVSAAPATGFDFSSWTNATGTAASGTVVMDGNKTVTANFTAKCYTLTTAVSPDGGGQVTVKTASNCAGGKYTHGTPVEVSATPATGYNFTSWTNASGNASSATVTMNGDRTVTANFTIKCYTLGTDVSPSGGGTVTVKTAPNCETNKYSHGTPVEVSATVNPGYNFSSWTNATGTAASATVTMDNNKTVTANFTAKCYTLTTGASPSGGGQVTVKTAPNCETTKYSHGTPVEVSATPATGYDFTSWSNASGSAASATVTMDGDKTVTANFTIKCYTLGTAVSPSGGGQVTVKTAPNCQSTKYTHGTPVEVSATVNTGYNFTSWTNATGNAASATVTMDGDKTVTANFTIKCYSLSTGVSPNGSGQVTIKTAANCTGGKYTHGTPVELSATPATGYEFTSWTDASGPASAGTVTMDGDKSVTANFTLKCYSLTTATNPNGAGTITVKTASNCAAGKYTHGTPVEVSATTNYGYTFKDWTNATGTATSATLVMDTDKTVTANYTPNCYTLTRLVIPEEGGFIGISFNAPANNCPAGQFPYNTVVRLTANLNPGYSFVNWTGDIPAQVTDISINVTMDQNKTVTANFSENQVCYTLTLQSDPADGGTVTPLTGPNCSGGRYTAGTVVSLTATANEGYSLSGWTNATAGTGTTGTVTMDANKTVTANFNLISGPSLASFTPGKLLAGSGNISLVIKGSGFGTGCRVRWNGELVDTSLVEVISATEMRLKVQAGWIAAPGSATIKVRNGAGGLSNTLSIEIVEPAGRLYLPVATRQ